MPSPREWQEILKGAFQGEMGFDVALKDYTSLSIGGPADVFVIPEEPISIRNLMVILRTKGISFMTLGSGTNVLVSDAGFEGVVISLKSFRRVEVLKEGNENAELFVEAGVQLQKLVNFCKENGYSGVEGLTGIPGTVGGAIFGNAGSYGCEIKDVISSVAIMDSNGKLDRYKAEGLGFSYRSSGIKKDDIILSANLVLKRDDKDAVSKKTESFFTEKKNAQPIGESSAGCVFKNHPGGEPAGVLIDKAGCKGMKTGGIEVSTKHANFFVNKGGGSASDYLHLMDKVSGMVKERFGIVLEPEIRIVGRK